MSHMPQIDNEEPLFQFDSYEAPAEGDALEHPTNFTHKASIDVGNTTTHLLPFALSSSDLDILDQTTPRDMDEQNVFEESKVGKGKEVSEPMPIRPQVIADTHDTFDIGSSGANYITIGPQPSTSYTLPSPLTSGSFDLQYIQSPLDDICQKAVGPSQEDSIPIPGSSFDNDSRLASGPFLRKGKAKELAPVLPPLQFSPTEFGYSNAEWPSPALNASTPGPSSYGSGYGSIIESNITLTANRGLLQSPPILIRMPSRRRSFSNVSIRSTRSMATLSMFPTKIKAGTSRVSGHLARKLFFRSRAGSSSSSSPSHTPCTATPGGNPVDRNFSVGQGSCLMPWRNEFKSQMKDVPLSIPYLNLEAQLEGQSLPMYGRSQIAVDFKGKGRTNSSPFPASALGIIPSVSTKISTPIAIVPRNFFNNLLPRELQLKVLSSVVALHEADHQRSVREGEWTVLRASSSKHRWVGKDKGIRELVKLSRVSKSWQVLVFDGQIWSDLDLRAFPRIPPSLLTRLSRFAGAFVKSIDASGHVTLLPSTLLHVTSDLCLKQVSSSQLSHTQLTSINFQGCAALTTRSLRDLLIRSPSLQTIRLKGLTAVTNATCDVLGVYCAQVTLLDISRCLNVDGQGLRSFISAGLNRGGHLPLKELRISGIKRVNDEVLATLGKGAPFLEVLDLSYARDLHNSALEAFISCSDDDTTEFKTILLTAREAGREPGDTTKYRRRVTRLRHLSLSSCVLLTDIACSNLAHTVPHLEYLELAGIGTELKDDGLVRLLTTTPLIRRLDLEDASEITDTLMAAITPRPVVDATGSGSIDPSEPGHALEHVVLSYAANITDEAFLSLIQNCTRLSVLEADNTRMSGTVLKEFVRLSRMRKMVNPAIVAIDCRGVGESVVKELNIATRPRKGWRSFEARKLGYVDGRDKEDLKVGRDECDEMRVVLKSFYSWQTVDAVRAAREKRKKTKRAANESNGNTSDSDDRFSSSGRARWWSPSGRRSSGTTSPAVFDASSDRDQCRIM